MTEGSGGTTRELGGTYWNRGTTGPREPEPQEASEQGVLQEPVEPQEACCIMAF